MEEAIKKMLKSQKAGDQSTNVQAESITINQGITYSEVREIVLDIFHSNFAQLSEKASIIARDRAKEITDTFLKKLEAQNYNGIANAQDPDFQYALFTIQKEYARNGDKDLGDLLVDLLVDRTKYDRRTILQIVLNESLSVAPKLTSDQLATLSIVFLINYAMFNGLKDLPTFLNFLDTYFAPFANLLSKNRSCYQHLEFAGCGSVGMGEFDILNSLKKNYQGLFSKGFNEEEIDKMHIKLSDFPLLFTYCLHDTNIKQINALNEIVLKDIAKNSGVSEQALNILISLNNNFSMSNEEIRDYIIRERGYMKNVFEVWKNSLMKNLTLTSVGIAIGHANIKRNLNIEFADLSIWIN